MGIRVAKGDVGNGAGPTEDGDADVAAACEADHRVHHVGAGGHLDHHWLEGLVAVLGDHHRRFRLVLGARGPATWLLRGLLLGQRLVRVVPGGRGGRQPPGAHAASAALGDGRGELLRGGVVGCVGERHRHAMLGHCWGMISVTHAELKVWVWG